jgi:hypothetical protein
MSIEQIRVWVFRRFLDGCFGALSSPIFSLALLDCAISLVRKWRLWRYFLEQRQTKFRHGQRYKTRRGALPLAAEVFEVVSEAEAMNLRTEVDEQRPNMGGYSLHINTLNIPQTYHV